MSDLFEVKQFGHVDVNDPFFDSLKNDYDEFEEWFERKRHEQAYVIEDGGRIIAFLYLKVEKGPVTDVEPALECPKKRVKIGTVKVDPHGTRLGERSVKKALDFAMVEGAKELYVTIFPKHETLVGLFEMYGFREQATKTTSNGTELVLVKSLEACTGDFLLDYPIVDARGTDKYLLSIYPDYHTQLFPDSILTNEPFDVIDDVSHTNSIHKVYICRMEGVSRFQRGDVLVIYRTSDNQGPAWYRSVATSICVVEEMKPITEFDNRNSFVDYCRQYSVFTSDELKSLYTEYRFVVKMTYNLAMRKRTTRQRLVEEVGLEAGAYWGVLTLTDEQFAEILKVGEVDEGFVIH